MAQAAINLSLFGSKVARGTPNRVFAFPSFLNTYFTNAHALSIATHAGNFA